MRLAIAAVAFLVALPLAAPARSVGTAITFTLNVSASCQITTPQITGNSADASKQNADLEKMLTGCSLSGASPELTLAPNAAEGAYVATINF